jgi:hypothetical protein
MTTGFFAYSMGRSPFGLRLRFSQRLIQLGRRSTKDVATDELSEDATTEGQRTLYGFRAVYVFDISQTEGRELPTLTEVQGDVSGYRERLVKFVRLKRSLSCTEASVAPLRRSKSAKPRRKP